MRLEKIILVLLASLLLTNCAMNRSNVGASLGATTTTGACVSSADSKIPKRQAGTKMPLWPGDKTFDT